MLCPCFAALEMIKNCQFFDCVNEYAYNLFLHFLRMSLDKSKTYGKNKYIYFIIILLIILVVYQSSDTIDNFTEFFNESRYKFIYNIELFNEKRYKVLENNGSELNKDSNLRNKFLSVINTKTCFTSQKSTRNSTHPHIPKTSGNFV